MELKYTLNDKISRQQITFNTGTENAEAPNLGTRCMLPTHHLSKPSHIQGCTDASAQFNANFRSPVSTENTGRASF